jgi:hypothetical protein
MSRLLQRADCHSYFQSTGIKLDTAEIGYAYNFGKSDVATDILDNYWSGGLSKHRNVENDEGPKYARFGKGLEDVDESMHDKAKVNSKQPIRTRVSLPAAYREHSLIRKPPGDLHQRRNQAIQDAGLGPSCVSS